jgi:SAM-dependent methyltransferase
VADEALFDAARLRAKADRAKNLNQPDADFLVRHVADELADRLSVTNRTFLLAADLFSPSPALAERIMNLRPEINLYRRTDEEGHSRADFGLPAGSLDLVVSAFGLHRCNDLPGALLQIRRALKPDGLFMAAIPGDGTLAEFRAALISAETALTGGASLRFDPFADVRQAGQLLQRAGFALPVTDTEKLVLRYRDVEAIVRDLRANGAGNVLAGRMRPLPHGIGSALQESYQGRDGRLEVTVNLVYLTGWVPHESQQKPLRPGSAAASLTDVLKP